MKQLSERAKAYLNGLTRENGWSCERETVIQYLERQNLGLIKPLVRFEAQYSGLDLTIKSQPGETFFLRLFSVDDINENSEILYFEDRGIKVFDCGYHKTAQYNFYINEVGQIMVSITDDYCLVLYSSVEIMVEIYALLDSLAENTCTTPVFHVKELDDLLLSLMYDGFKEMEDCCDEQNHVLYRDSVMVYCSPFWDDDNKICLRIYGADKNKCEQLADGLKKNGFIDFFS